MRKILSRMEDKQNGTWLCSDHEDFPIANAQPGLAEGQPDGPLVGGNVASQLNRIQPLLFHVVSS
jgi:hypothetical protein